MLADGWMKGADAGSVHLRCALGSLAHMYVNVYASMIL